MDGWIDVGTQEEPTRGRGLAVFLEDGREVALFNVEGTLHCTDNICPHVQGPLGDGHLEGEIVTCPWHGWQFNVRTGECLDRPDRPVAVYPVRLEEGRILVDPGRPAQPSDPGGALGA